MTNLLIAFTIVISAKLSYYNPSICGSSPINCFDPDQWWSMAAGHDARNYWEKALACPEEFPIGSKWILPVIKGAWIPAKEWICLDRGGGIKSSIDINGSLIVNLDLLVNRPIISETVEVRYVGDLTPKIIDLLNKLGKSYALPITQSELKMSGFFIMPPRTQEFYQSSLNYGNIRSHFSVIGDSHSATSMFIAPIPQVYGSGSYDIDQYSRKSLAASNGWDGNQLLDEKLSPKQTCGDHETPVGCELRVNKPVAAFVMFGTNCVVNDSCSTEDFENNLRRIIRVIKSYEVIPILTTIPDNLLNNGDYYKKSIDFNKVIREMAFEYEIPLWDYWSQIHNIENHGLSSDLVHVTPRAYDIRNYGARIILESLTRFRQTESDKPSEVGSILDSSYVIQAR